MRALALSGRRERVVLRAGRRVRGRIWDAARTAGFRLRFTRGELRAVGADDAAAGRDHARRGGRGRGQHAAGRRQIRRIVKIAETDTGDWLLYALAVRHLARVDMPPQIREELGRRLSLGSPLAMPVRARGPGGGERADAARADRSPARAPSAVVLVECLDDLLATQWAEQIAAAMRSSSGERRSERLEAIGRVLEVWVDRLDAHGRIDLSRSLGLAFARLLAGAWGRSPTRWRSGCCRARA
jgi:hypothetical protein